MLKNELDFLYGLMREGVKLDLSIMGLFSKLVGHPELEFNSFHVAGTNGKGSTASFIYNILRQKYRTGLYTSPHLVKFNERIIFGLDQIDDEYIGNFISKYRKTILDLAGTNRNPTFFETTTLLAFKYFADMKAEYAAVEVGLGGRLDSTNIITPEISIITQIGYEHADKLGCSLTAIATEKAGIIKKGIPVVLSDEKPEVLRTIKSIAEARGSELFLAPAESKVKKLSITEEGTRFTLVTDNDKYEIETTILGDFQVRNIATAVVALEHSNAESLTAKDVEKGIHESRWPARVEVIKSSPKVVIDSAHNPPAAFSLVKTFRKVFRKKPLLVVGMLSDKDAYSYLSVLKQLSDKIVFTSPREEHRAMDPEKMNRLYGGMFRNSLVVKDPVEAYEYALGKSGLILVTGSMYLVGLIKGYENGEVMPYDLN